MIWLWVAGTQCNIQLMYQRNVHLKPIWSINQCQPNTFNKNYSFSIYFSSCSKRELYYMPWVLYHTLTEQELSLKSALSRGKHYHWCSQEIRNFNVYSYYKFPSLFKISPLSHSLNLSLSLVHLPPHSSKTFPIYLWFLLYHQFTFVAF